MRFFQILAVMASFPVLSQAGAISSGTITIAGLSPTGTFNLSGSDFTASGNFSLGAWAAVASTWAAGTTVGTSGFELGNDFGVGAATIGASNFSNLGWGNPNAAGPSTFTLTGTSIQLTNGPGTYHGTFSFTGSLCGTQFGSTAIPAPCLVTLAGMTGSGYVDVNLVSAGIPNVLAFSSATYTFTPEPGTFLLLLAGLAAIVGGRRYTSRRT